jgi:hypothetical protein
LGHPLPLVHFAKCFAHRFYGSPVVEAEATSAAYRLDVQFAEDILDAAKRRVYFGRNDAGGAESGDFACHVAFLSSLFGSCRRKAKRLQFSAKTPENHRKTLRKRLQTADDQGLPPRAFGFVGIVDDFELLITWQGNRCSRAAPGQDS